MRLRPRSETNDMLDVGTKEMFKQLIQGVVRVVNANDWAEMSFIVVVRQDLDESKPRMAFTGSWRTLDQSTASAKRNHQRCCLCLVESRALQQSLTIRHLSRRECRMSSVDEEAAKIESKPFSKRVRRQWDVWVLLMPGLQTSAKGSSMSRHRMVVRCAMSAIGASQV